MARWRQGAVENKGSGIRIEDPAPDLAAIARALSLDGFGPALDKAIEIVGDGKSAVVDVITQPR